MGTSVVSKKEDISITMGRVIGSGNTVITVHDNVKEIETEGKTFLPVYYGVTTTADIEGDSIVEISYDITGYEKHKNNLRLYHITDGKYTDITQNISYEEKDGRSIMNFEGKVDGFSYFAVGFTQEEKSKRLLEVTAVGSGEIRLNDEVMNLPQNYKDSFEYGTKIKLTAIPDTSSEFAYWEEVNTGRLISTNPVYKTIITAGENIKAVFYKKVTEETNEFTVVFKDRGGRILKSTNVSKNQSAIPPKEPAMTGYQFVGWDTDFSNVTSNMIISPVFKRLSDKYVITVEGGTLSTGETTGEYKFDMPVKVVANEEDTGMKFSHWTMDGRKVSIDVEFSFFMPKKDIVLTAVFVEETETVDTAPFITLSEDVIVNSDDKSMIFVANRSIGEDYTLIESGVILLKAGADYADEITLETENILRGRIHNDSTDQFYVRKINVAAEDIWYARAYLIYKDQEGNVFTVYSQNTAKGIMK
jgi:hypothetical protein